MTSEEIAEVRETYTGKSSSEAQLFIRLLDEREALLEAAKFIVENWNVFDGHEADVSEHHAMLVNAVAKAETP